MPIEQKIQDLQNQVNDLSNLLTHLMMVVLFGFLAVGLALLFVYLHCRPSGVQV